MVNELMCIKISWNQISEIISDRIFAILGKQIKCTVTYDDWDFWYVKFDGYEMPISEIEQICDRINADETERQDAFPYDGEGSVRSFGPPVATKLLSIGLKCQWEEVLAKDDCLWLLNCSMF